MPFCRIIQVSERGMKKRILYAFLVLVLCFCFLQTQKIGHEKFYKILKISGDNKICIDLNGDSKCSEREYFKLKHIILPDESQFGCYKKANAYLNTLIDKEITFETYPSCSSKYVQIYLNGEDVGLLMLKKRLAAPYYRDLPARYVLRGSDLKLFQRSYRKTDKTNFKKYPEIVETRYPNGVFGAIEAYFINPNKYSNPSSKARTNFARALIYNIDNSKTSIDAALYGIEDQREILNALLRAKKRGVRVRIVTDSNPHKPDTYRDTYILRKEFAAISDNSPYIMHNKFFIFDARKTAVLTLNISPTGSGGYNANTALIINSKALASAYLSEFEQMYAGKFHKNKEKIETKDIALDKNTVLSVYFSPVSDILSPVLNAIKNAQSEILVSAFYLTHGDIIDELINAQKRGVRVLVIIDALSSSNFKNQVNTLRQNGVKVKVENWGGKNHQKNILIDSKTFVTGSANFSKSAVLNNDENLLIVQNPYLSKAYRKYFFELYNSIDNKFLYTFVSAESLMSKNSCFDGIDNDFDGKTDLEDEGCFAAKRR